MTQLLLASAKNNNIVWCLKFTGLKTTKKGENIQPYGRKEVFIW